jgi:hypothetical protein
MNASIPPEKCPECGASLVSGAKDCWLCRLKKSGSQPGDGGSDAKATNPYASPAPPRDASLNRTFSLSTMFLWTTLVAVVAALGRIEPGLAIGLAVLSFPAALRTIWSVGRRKMRTGQRMTGLEKIETFLASLGIVLAIVTGAAIAFTATCFPIGLAGFSMNWDGGWIFLGAIAGLLVAGAVAFLLIRRLWPTRE